MPFPRRLGFLLLVTCACVALYEWHLVTTGPQELTQAALRQFENSNSAAENLRAADAAKGWWLVGGGAALVALWTLFFWDDVERWWKRGTPG